MSLEIKNNKEAIFVLFCLLVGEAALLILFLDGMTMLSKFPRFGVFIVGFVTVFWSITIVIFFKTWIKFIRKK